MKAVFQVRPFECTACVKRIEKQLTDEAGVISVKIFPRLRKVRIKFDETTIPIKKILRHWGYPIQSDIRSSNKKRKTS